MEHQHHAKTMDHTHDQKYTCPMHPQIIQDGKLSYLRYEAGADKKTER